MSSATLILLLALFFVTSVVGVVTGSNSLITVPVMFQAGIDEKVAVATNMFGLTFMAAGGTIPFLRSGRLEWRPMAPLAIATVIGSGLGALLVGWITDQSLKAIVTIAMVAVAIFIIAYRAPKDGAPRKGYPKLTLLLAFALAIYGGLYSGGYVTVLTAVLVAFGGMGFGGAIASTKLINVFSSSVATAVFMWQGLVDYKLGIMLAATMFAGAFLGAHFAAKMNEVLLRRIFLATVFMLAAKTLFDLAAG
jgi:uncharacterized protein